MIDRDSKELLRAFAPRLKQEFHVDPFLPLELKLWVERLRLKETLDEMRWTTDTLAEFEAWSRFEVA